ncbi:MAG: PH domain-containing protein [Lachnospiraceae bacterium]|nr:PH domain-containing protein [Lachnospiraceae bacterium]MBR3166612.1 PH domain-containing protein [Lachnospiraceae bacterium]
MIDFANGSFVKLKATGGFNNRDQILPLLVPGEEFIGEYQAIRDYVIFTNKRVISVNVQGITGKKKDFTSMPYSKISVFSIETSGTFDLDSELELYFSGVGKVKFEFSGRSDIVEIGQIISQFALK